ncbi:hypothetical protein BH24ACI3_BH24ACI3_10320 [soil metagenome]
MMIAMPQDDNTTASSAFDAAGSIDEIYSRCCVNAPNFGVEPDCFKASVEKSLNRFVDTSSDDSPSSDSIRDFLEQLQCDDLFLALACANGNERAWWEFDQQHRAYMERVARHLAKTELDAQEVIDTVYVELYGTRVVDGERVSKFSTYSGRGSLRGWLRTVIWHSLVDLHRASHDEISLDEMTENLGEGGAQANFAEQPSGGEDEMIAQITQDRYRKATVTAIDKAFRELEPHEKLLLLYYHVDNLKLREIAKLVENEDSPLRGWFQRRSATRDLGGRTHESTVMRWLEKSYSRILELFLADLKGAHSMSQKEIDICLDLATQDLTGSNIFARLTSN